MDEAELIEARKRRYERDLWWIEHQCAQVADGSIEDAAYVVWANRHSSIRWPGDPDFPLPPAVDLSVPGYFMGLPDGTSRKVAAGYWWPIPEKTRHRLQVLRPNASRDEVDVAVTQAEQLETYAHANCFMAFSSQQNPVLSANMEALFPGFSKMTLGQAVSHALAHMTQ